MYVRNLTKITVYYFCNLFFPSLDHVKNIIFLLFAGNLLLFSASENLIFRISDKMAFNFVYLAARLIELGHTILQEGH